MGNGKDCDIAAKLLAMARDEARARPFGIVYKQGNAEYLSTLANFVLERVLEP